MEGWQLKQKQSLPTQAKIHLAHKRIQEWYEHWDGQVYVAFSGGKDSTVLLHLVRQLYPDVPAVFADTGLEFPEIREFVKTIDNVVWVKPRKGFKEIINSHGYPVVSKNVAMAISRCRNTKDPVQRELRLHGGVNPSSGKKQVTGVIPKKWHFLVDAPFKISERCCDVLKKQPFKAYEKTSGRVPFVGTMADDSNGRRMEYIKHGCNSFGGKQSKPLSVFTESDIWEYIKQYELPYSTIYDKGYHNTGCVFCAFGCHMEADPNRFQYLKKTHPKLHAYCMDQLGLREVLDYIGVPCD